MANELKHKDAGTSLTRTEDNAVDRHEADGQLANDMLYFNGTSWIRATPATIAALVNSSIDHGGLSGLADDDHTQYIKHALATAANDMLMASGAGVFIKKTLAEAKAALGVAPDIGARVYNDANQTTTTGSYLVLGFNQERYDTDTIHDTVTNNSRLTCKTAGKYLIAAAIRFQENATGVREVLFQLNASVSICYSDFNAVVGRNHYFGIATVYNLAVNDYVELWAWQNSGGDLPIQAANAYSPEFMMQKVG